MTPKRFKVIIGNAEAYARALIIEGETLEEVAKTLKDYFEASDINIVSSGTLNDIVDIVTRARKDVRADVVELTEEDEIDSWNELLIEMQAGRCPQCGSTKTEVKYNTHDGHYCTYDTVCECGYVKLSILD